MKTFSGKTLLVATHNRGKRDEIADLLADFGVSVVSADDLALAVPEETENTFVGNARLKARAACEATGLVSLADDSGLTVDALGGAPGIHTADWAETGQGRDFGLAMSRTHEALLAAKAPTPWHAQFRCTLVMAWPDGTEAVFEGAVAGQLVWPPRGDVGHGYDPMFLPDGFDLTFGEMDRWKKNRMSHRADAFRKLVAQCFT